MPSRGEIDQEKYRAIEIKVVEEIKISIVGETEELVLVRDLDQENGNEASAVGETEGTVNILKKNEKSCFELNVVLLKT